MIVMDTMEEIVSKDESDVVVEEEEKVAYLE